MAKHFETVFEIAGKVAGSFDKSLLSAGKNLQQLQKQISALSPVDANIAKFRELKTQLNSTETEYQQLGQQISQMAKQMHAAGPPTKQMVQQFEIAKLRAASLKQSITEQSTALHRQRQALAASGIQTTNLHGSMQKLAAQQRLNAEAQQRMLDIQQRAAAVEQRLLERQRKIRAEQEKYTAALNKTRDAIAANQAARDNYRSQMGDALALGASVGVPVKIAADREFALAQIGTLTGLGSEQLKALQKQAEATANATYNSYDSVITSLNMLLAEGMKIEDATNLQGIIGKTATASNSAIEDITKTANALSASLNIKDAATMEQAFEKLVAAGKAGSFELKDMAQYFPQLTAQAKSLGLTGVDGVVTMAASLQMARKGAADAASAAGNFNNFLSKLTAPETKKRFADMGVNIEQAFKDSIAAGKDPVVEMIKLIEQMTGGDKFRIGELFGDMQVIDFLNPVLADMKEYERLMEEIRSANGGLDADFKRMSATSTKQFTLLANNVSNLGSALGTILLPAVNNVASTIAVMAGWVGKAAEEYPVLTETIVTITAGLAALKVAAIAAGYAGTFMRGIWLTMKSVALTVKGLTAVQWLWNAALAANPIGAVVAAIGLLIAAGVMLYKNWDEVKAGAAALWASLGQLWSDIMAWFGNIDLTESGMKMIQTLIDGIKAKAGELVQSVKDTLAGVREYLPFSDAKTGPLSQLTASGKAIMTTLGDGVNQGAGSLSGAVNGALQQDLSVPAGMGQKAGPSITYSPTIQVTGTNADQIRQNVAGALRDDRSAFDRQMQQYMNNEARLSFA